MPEALEAEDALEIWHIGGEARIGFALLVRGGDEDALHAGIGGAGEGGQAGEGGEEKDESDGLHGLAPSFCASRRRA